MKKFLALILAVSLLLPSIPVQASTITEKDLINLISESSDTLESYEFTDETAAYAALESAQTYVNTLSGNLDEVYNNLSSEMNALKLNDTSVDIPRIGEINKTYGINVDSLIPIIKEAEETNSGITWITGEVIYPEDLFFYMYYYGINSIEVTLTDTNISDVINICEYASSTDMSICIDGKEDNLLSGYNVFYKNDMVVDKKVKTLTDQEMVNYILSNIYTDEIFYYNSDTLITTNSTSNIIKVFNPVYLKYGTINGNNANMFTVSDDSYDLNDETLYTISVNLVDKETNSQISDATIKITNSNNEEIATWTTSDKSYTVENIKPDTYTIIVSNTPSDYNKIEDTTIILNSDGTSNTDYVIYAEKKVVETEVEVTVSDTKPTETQIDKEKVTVSFDSMGAEIDPCEMIVNKGSTITVPKITNPGYKFLGWYDSDGNKLTSKTVILQDTKYFAKWEEILYTISFDTNGGSKIDDVKLKYNTKIKTLPVPSKTGYVFRYWTYEGNPVNINLIINKDIKLVAVYDACLYDIHYKLNGGINNEKNAEYATYDSVLKLYNPTRKGYTFKGWYVDNKKVTNIKIDGDKNKNNKSR